MNTVNRKWLLQPVKIENDKMEHLMYLLEKAGIDYDLVYPLEGKVLNGDKSEYEFNDNTQYVVCGSYPLTRYVNNKVSNAVFSLENYDFKSIWNIFGKENFVNADANVCHTQNIHWLEEEYFVRPLEDKKAFNGGIYNKNTLTYNGEVVLSSLKHVDREYRFFVIDGEITTGSLYKVNGRLEESDIIDIQAKEFAQKMVDKFNYSYVIDVALVNGQYKIMELNCLNAAGFYASNLYKLVLAIEDHYEKIKTKK